MQGLRFLPIALLLAIGSASPAVSQVAAPPPFEVLRTFDNPPVRPMGGLVQGEGGLYGTSQGGDYGRGLVFRIAPPEAGASASAEKVVSFTDDDYAAGRGAALGELLRASNGDIYGLRGRGFSYYPANPQGSIFRLSAAGVLTTLHDFAPTDGAVNEYLGGQGPLVEMDGLLYGALYYGGPTNRGALFRIGLDGSGYEVLHRFGGPEGERPEGGLLRVGEWLYGTASSGGTEGGGTIFRLSESQPYEAVHHFARASEGFRPRGALVLGPDGRVYGATTVLGPAGCGTVFRFDPASPQVLDVLHSFACASTEGVNPEGGMVVLAGADGNPVVFGVATAFSNAGKASIYRLVPGGGFAVLASLWGSDRCLSQLHLAGDGLIYGQCYGNRPPEAGRVFRIDPATGEVSTFLRYGIQDGGRVPFALIEGRDGRLYGSTRFGGTENRGTVFRFSDDGAVETLHSFTDGAASWDPGLSATSTQPMRPSDTFLTHASDGWLYGTRCDGGAWGEGGIFRLDPYSGDTQSHGYELLHSTDNTSTANVVTGCPHGPLLESAVDPGTFLGTAMGMSLRDAGTAFRFVPGSAPQPLWLPGNVLDYSRYTEPVGSLVERPDGAVYSAFTVWNPEYYFIYGGVARSPAGGGVSRVAQFSWNGPYGPTSGLVEGPSNESGAFTLYGTSPRGGYPGFGTVYKVTVPPAGSPTLTVLRSFGQGPDGQGPRAELVRGPGGLYYGTTAFGGQHGHGTVFALGADEQVVTIHHFDQAGGANPETQLVAGSDGSLYGVTGAGGPKGGGVLFRLNVAPVVEIGGPYAGDEGSSVTLDASGADPQGGDLAYAWDLDDDGVFDDATGATVSYGADRDGDGQYPVSVRVTNAMGLSAVATTTVAVSNVAPSVSLAPLSLALLLGEPAALAGSFTDPGPDAWTLHVDYGDGTSETRELSYPGAFALGHAYATPGTYDVVVSVSDGDGGSGQAAARVEVGSAQANITWLIQQIQGLIDDGTLKLGQGKSLIGKLELALYMLEYGNTKKAITMLEAFIQEAEAFRRAGILEEALADQLIAAAQAAIASLAR